MLEYRRAAHGVTPLMIGPSVMATESLMIGRWSVEQSQLQATVLGELAQMFCGYDHALLSIQCVEERCEGAQNGT